MITKIEEIKCAVAPVETELSGWEPGKPFVCLLRRPQMYQLIASGAILNPLLPTVERLFTAAIPPNRDPAERADEAKALLGIARAALVQPSMEELDEAGIELTAEQVLQIYSFVLSGAIGLAAFRRGSRGGIAGDGTGDAGEAIGADRDSGR